MENMESTASNPEPLESGFDDESLWTDTDSEVEIDCPSSTSIFIPKISSEVSKIETPLCKSGFGDETESSSLVH
jgi:hypothetical protein